VRMPIFQKANLVRVFYLHKLVRKERKLRLGLRIAHRLRGA
jgi:hypothetical protein